MHCRFILGTSRKQLNHVWWFIMVAIGIGMCAWHLALAWHIFMQRLFQKKKATGNVDLTPCHISLEPFSVSLQIGFGRRASFKINSKFEWRKTSKTGKIETIDIIMIRMGVDNLWFHNAFFSSLGKKPLFKKKSRQPWQMWNIPCAMTITREFDCLNRICLEALQIQKIGPYRYLDSITVTWSWVLNLPYVSVRWCYMLLSLWCATSMFRAHFLPFCVSSKSSIVDFDHVCRSASFFRRRALSKHTKQPYTENGSPFRLCFPHCMFVHCRIEAYFFRISMA